MLDAISMTRLFRFVSANKWWDVWGIPQEMSSEELKLEVARLESLIKDLVQPMGPLATSTNKTPARTKLRQLLTRFQHVYQGDSEDAQRQVDRWKDAACKVDPELTHADLFPDSNDGLSSCGSSPGNSRRPSLRGNEIKFPVNPSLLMPDSFSQGVITFEELICVGSQSRLKPMVLCRPLDSFVKIRRPRWVPYIHASPNTSFTFTSVVNALLQPTR